MPAPKPASASKKGPAAKEQKAAAPLLEKPAWVSDGLWEVSKNTAQLVDRLKLQDDASTESGGSQAEVAQLVCHIMETSPAKRDELLKLGIIEITASIISQPSNAAVHLLGSLRVLSASSAAARDAILVSKPSILPAVTAALSEGIPGKAAAALGLLQILASSEDSQAKLLKALSDWDFQSLPESIASAETGGAIVLLEALVCESASTSQRPPEQQAGKSKSSSAAPAKPAPKAPAKKGAGKGRPESASDAAATARAQLIANAVRSGTILPALLQVCSSGSLDVANRTAGLKVVHAMVAENNPRAALQLVKDGGLSAIVKVLSDADITMACKAVGAAILKAFLLPQYRPAPPVTAPAKPRPSLRATNAPGTIENIPPAIGNRDPPAAVPSADTLLDEAMARIEDARHAGALPALLSLCRLPDAAPGTSHITPAGGASEAPPGKAKKAGGQARGPGGADVAQSTALSCLRVMSLHDDCKQGIADCGGIPILLPFLTVKVDTVRWAARQTLLNMAMLPEVAEQLEKEGAPTYIHGMNLVRLRRAQPGRQGSAAATKLLAQLSSQLSAQLSAPPVQPTEGKA